MTKTPITMANKASITKQEKLVLIEECINYAHNKTTFGWRNVIIPQKTAKKLKQTLLSYITMIAYSYSMPGPNSIVASMITLNHSNKEI